MSKFVGIDIGASFIKGAIFDLDKLTVKKITKFPTPKPQKNISKKQSFHVRFEIDGKDYLIAVKRLINNLILHLSFIIIHREYFL